MKLIDLHKEWCETGNLPNEGLCCSVPALRSLIDDFAPEEFVRHSWNRTPEELRKSYWGYGGSSNDRNKILFEYTPLRQTIVLFIAAMKNEI